MEPHPDHRAGPRRLPPGDRAGAATSWPRSAARRWSASGPRPSPSSPTPSGPPRSWRSWASATRRASCRRGARSTGSRGSPGNRSPGPRACSSCRPRSSRSARWASRSSGGTYLRVMPWPMRPPGGRSARAVHLLPPVRLRPANRVVPDRCCSACCSVRPKRLLRRIDQLLAVVAPCGSAGRVLGSLRPRWLPGPSRAAGSAGSLEGLLAGATGDAVADEPLGRGRWPAVRAGRPRRCRARLGPGPSTLPAPLVGARGQTTHGPRHSPAGGGRPGRMAWRAATGSSLARTTADVTRARRRRSAPGPRARADSVGQQPDPPGGPGVAVLHRGPPALVVERPGEGLGRARGGSGPRTRAGRGGCRRQPDLRAAEAVR